MYVLKLIIFSPRKGSNFLAKFCFKVLNKNKNSFHNFKPYFHLIFPTKQPQ
jgi:hypothetical protein